MKNFRQAFRFVLKKVRQKSLEPASAVCEAAVSKSDMPEHAPTKTLASHHVPHHRLNSECITIFVSTGDRSSKADSGDNDSTPATDASPSATVSSRTSVGAVSVSADQRYKADLAALGLVMKLPLRELSLIASDSNFFLSSGEAIKEADFCAPKASAKIEIDETPQEIWSKSNFDIFEEKRGADDAIPQKAVPTSATKSDTVLPDSNPTTADKSDNKPLPILSNTKPHPGHPAFLTDAEFAALPLYEDVEDDPSYDGFYTRTNESFASMASLSSFISTDNMDNFWVPKIKMGVDIGGDLHFFGKGVKRKASVKSSNTSTFMQVADDDEGVEFSPKRRDCRIREKLVLGRFSWEYGYGQGSKWQNNFEYAHDVDAEDSGDEDVLAGLNEFLAGQRKYEPGYVAMDDGYGGYGHEIF